MPGAVATLLPDGNRLHLQHGPIDLIIGADGDTVRAFHAAQVRFETVLDELVGELPNLRKSNGTRPKGHIACVMYDAVAPLVCDYFVTPMAAVAGSVAETILQAMVGATELKRAYVNNGGDIALHLSTGSEFTMAIAGPLNQDLGRITLNAQTAVRGLATSGQGGRSHSFGIADAVTVLADTAASADVAATLIANAVDLPGHANISKEPANALDPDSDLGARCVVTHVGALSQDEVSLALDRGRKTADHMRDRGLIHSASLFLRDQNCTTGQSGIHDIQRGKTLEYARS